MQLLFETQFGFEPQINPHYLRGACLATAFLLLAASISLAGAAFTALFRIIVCDLFCTLVDVFSDRGCREVTVREDLADAFCSLGDTFSDRGCREVTVREDLANVLQNR